MSSVTSVFVFYAVGHDEPFDLCCHLLRNFNSSPDLRITQRHLLLISINRSTKNQSQISQHDLRYLQ